MMSNGFIHLCEFPDDVRISLDSACIKELKEALQRTYNQEELSQMLGVSERQARRYLNGDRITVAVLKKISELLKKDHPKFDLRNLQMHVKGYWSIYGKRRINPILPIPESPHLGSIIVHMFCDGSVGKNHARYHNKCVETLEYFKKLLSNFGEVPVKGEGWKGTPCVDFPVVIARILAKKYYVPSFRSDVARIPNILRNKPRAWLIKMLEAALVDEGAIGDDIYIGVKNKQLLSDIREVAEKAGYACGKISCSGDIYRFQIFVENIQRLSEDLSSLPHPDKRREIEILKERQHYGAGHRHEIGGSKKLIINALLEGAKTVKELSEILKISLGKVRLHLHQLERIGVVHVVKKIRKKGHPSLWGISDNRAACALMLSIEENNGKSAKWFSLNVYQSRGGGSS
ncbi:MAG: helix-turn-helix domain-containing protein [Candidatus Hadarchaeaceae archaeon]